MRMGFELSWDEVQERDVVELLENVVFWFDVGDDVGVLCGRAAQEIVELRRAVANARYILTGERG